MSDEEQVRLDLNLKHKNIPRSIEMHWSKRMNFQQGRERTDAPRSSFAMAPASICTHKKTTPSSVRQGKRPITPRPQNVVRTQTTGTHADVRQPCRFTLMLGDGDVSDVVRVVLSFESSWFEVRGSVQCVHTPRVTRATHGFLFL